MFVEHKITTKGQVTIPLYIREHMGMLPGVYVAFNMTDDGVHMWRSRRDGTRGKFLIDGLTRTSNGRLSTTDILRLTRPRAKYSR